MYTANIALEVDICQPVFYSEEPTTKMGCLKNENPIFMLDPAFVIPRTSLSTDLIAIDIRIDVPINSFLLHQEHYIVIAEHTEIIDIRAHVKSERTVKTQTLVDMAEQRQTKNKGVTETGNSSMVGRGGSITAIFVKSAKPINSSI